MGTRGNPDAIGCVWTGEFDLNTLRVDGEIFESGKKKLRIQKYPDTCGRGLREFKYDVSSKMKLLPSVYSYLYSEAKIFVFAVNRRDISIFV